MNYKYWILVVGVIIVSFILSALLRKVLSGVIKRRSDDINEDPTKFVFLKNSVPLIVLIIALIVVFIFTPKLNDIGKGLFAGAGILAASIGFASQKVFSNILSGIFILFFKPFRVRDTIELGSTSFKGVVEEITLRHTVIRDYENRRIIIPNSTISEATLVNSSIVDEKIRKHIEFGISYDSDIDLAKSIVHEEILNHKNFLDLRTKKEKKDGVPELLIRLVELADSSVKLRAYVWSSSNDKAFDLQCDVLESVKKRFDKEGIEIPFPHRTLIFKNQQIESPSLQYPLK